VIQTPPHIVRKTRRGYCTVLTATHTHMPYKAKQNDASLTFYKNEQTETSDRLVKTSDPLTNRLCQHPFSTALSQLYLKLEWKQQQQQQQQRNKAFKALHRHSETRTNQSKYPTPRSFAYEPSQQTNSSADSSLSRNFGCHRFSFLPSLTLT